MGLLSRLKEAIAPQQGTIEHPEPNPWGSWLPRTRYDYKREVGDGTGNSIVMATLLWMARNFPEAVIRVYENDSEDNPIPVPQHDLYTLLQRPNPYYSGILLQMATVIDFAATGNAYWIMIPSGTRRIVEFWWAPAATMKPVREKGSENYVDYYEYRPDPTKRKGLEIDPAYVAHFRYGLDPNNTMKGLSPLASVLREIFTDDEAANFSASLVRNLGIPGVVIVPGENTKVDKGKAETIKQSFMEKFTGDKRGEPMVMSAPSDVKVVSFSPEQLQLTSLRRVPEERVTAVTGISAVVVGLGAGLDHMIYNNMSEARSIAYENGIMPIQRLFAAEMTVQVLSRFESNIDRRLVMFDNSKVRILQEDMAAIEARMRSGATAGLIERAEYRAAMGLDVRPEDHIYLLPDNLVETPVDLAAKGSIGLTIFKSKASRRGERKLIQGFAKLATQQASDFADTLYDMFYDLGTEVEKRMLELAREPAPTLVRSNGGSVALKDDSPPPEDWPTSWKGMLENPLLVNQVISDSEMNQRAESAYTGAYTQVAKSTSDYVRAHFDLQTGVNMDDPLMKQIIAEGGTRSGLIDLSGKTRDAIYNALVEARDLGYGPKKAAKLIADNVEGRNLYPGIWQRKFDAEIKKGRSESIANEAATLASNRYRSETIARTETKHAQNLSAVTAYEVSGVFKAIKVFDGDGCGWTSHKDPRKADGLIVSFDDARQHTLAHPRCVRSFAPSEKAASPQRKSPWGTITNPIEKVSSKIRDTIETDDKETQDTLMNKAVSQYTESIEQYSGQRPKPGSVELASDEDLEGAGGDTDLEGNIRLNKDQYGDVKMWGEDGLDRVIIHELIHTRSGPMQSDGGYIDNPGFEEGLVESLTTRISEELGLSADDSGTYKQYVKMYEAIADVADVDLDEMLKGLAAIPREELQGPKFFEVISDLRVAKGLEPIVKEDADAVEIGLEDFAQSGFSILSEGNTTDLVNDPDTRSFIEDGLWYGTPYYDQMTGGG